jgi:hypothetical protein
MGAAVPFVHSLMLRKFILPSPSEYDPQLQSTAYQLFRHFMYVRENVAFTSRPPTSDYQSRYAAKNTQLLRWSLRLKPRQCILSGRQVFDTHGSVHHNTFLIKMTNKMQLFRTISYSIVSWLLYMFRAILLLIIRSILTVITASGFIHMYSYRLLSWLSRNYSATTAADSNTCEWSQKL